MRWPWHRPSPPTGDAQPPPLAFDASIDIARPEAADTVRAYLRALPGAGWVSVEAHPGAPQTIRVFYPGSSVEGVGPEWDELARAIGQQIAAALAAVPPSDPAWTVPSPAPTGFAEALAASQFDALEQLAQLASRAKAAQLRPPEPLPPPNAAPARATPTRATPALDTPALDTDGLRLARLLALVLPADPAAAAAAATRRFGSYAAVLAAPQAELRRVPGLGTHSIAAVKLVHAAAIRLARAAIAAQPVLDDPARLHDYLAAALARERIEQFRILFLDEHGMLRADEIQASGTVNHTPVYPREVVRRALALGAASLVLVHNHPSGDPAPSPDDIDMTRQVRDAAAIMGIGLRDHLIVGNGRWLSFREQRLLD